MILKEREEHVMRIGNNILDIESLEVEDMDMVIKELKNLRTRRVKERNLMSGLVNLVLEAKENNFVFISKDTGEVLNPYDWELYDERK